MMFRGRELGPKSWLFYSAMNGGIEIVRADTVDLSDDLKRTHFKFIEDHPNTTFYFWPTTEELIKYFGEQHDVAGSGTD